MYQNGSYIAKTIRGAREICTISSLYRTRKCVTAMSARFSGGAFTQSSQRPPPLVDCIFPALLIVRDLLSWDYVV